jgi:hypothetical protein
MLVGRLLGRGVGMFDGAITPTGVRDDLVACCENAADWWRHRAAEFSQGGRNLAAAQALEVAAERLSDSA